MRDSPAADELLVAVAETLTRQVLPATDGATRHAVRVAANLCAIVAREMASPADGALTARLEQVVGGDPDTDLHERLDARLREDCAEFDAAVFDLVQADVARRVDIAKPGYRDT